ncbi:MAG: hypothetical protein Q8K23_05330 [Sulfuritalea sp.]|jgi:hypothetical protein|nr:hypothetical protein [Sulfuritalea sp.]
MNLLIYDPSLVPDAGYQQRIVQLFSRIADISVRFATGVLQATWHMRNFRPDIIVFDWIGDHLQIKRLIAMLHGIKPDVAMFHLGDSGSFVSASPLGSAAEPAVPTWLHDIASPWILARCIAIPAVSSRDRS